ncbi:uncharacterized protein LOC120341773 [Styela clava]
MSVIAKVGIILGITLCVGGQDYGDIYTESGDIDYEEYTDTPDPFADLSKHRELVNKWYGSDKIANESLWTRSSLNYNDTTCSLDMAWVLNEARTTLLTRETTLTTDEQNLVISTIDDLIKDEIDKSMEDDHKNKKLALGSEECLTLFDELKDSRSHLDCVLSPQVVSSYFTNMFPPTRCWEFTEGLWEDIIAAGNFDDRCSSIGAYTDLVRVAQIAKARYRSKNWDTGDSLLHLTLMAKLSETISSPSHLQYLNKIACPIHPPKTTSCPEVVSIVRSTVCGPLSLSTVKQIEDIVKAAPMSHPSTAIEDMAIMMELLGDLTEVVDTLSKSKIQSRDSMEYAVKSLNTYLDIVDNTIGEHSKEIWTEMPTDKSQERLQFVLVNNEQYVGALTEIMWKGLRDVNTTGLEKKSMALQLLKMPRDSATKKVGFEFDEVNIETDLEGSANQTGDAYKVFAIHYKSWSELMGKTGLYFGNTSLAQKDKTFIGKGGIISLTAHMDEEKKSVPVSYKMKFGDKIEISDNSSSTRSKHRCLSCEYLNTTTGEWQNTGCYVKHADDLGVTCHCDHTTNFAAFMSPVQIQINMTDAQYQAKQIVGYVGSGVSVLALALSLIIFNVVRPTIRNDRLKAHMNLAIALFFVHATQLTVDFAINNDVACLSTAIITHFFLLASFFWMLIEGIFLYLYVVQVFVHSTVEYLKWVFLLGWIIPALVVAISAGVGIPNDTYLDLKPDNTYCKETEVLYPPLPTPTGSKYEQCWLSAKSGMSWSFIFPALIIILINFVILCKVVQVLVKVSGRSQTIRPFKPSTSSSGRKYTGRDTSSSYINKTYGQKDMDSHSKYKTSEAKTNKPKEGKSEPNTDYGSTSNGHSEKPPTTKNMNSSPRQSPSRFDGRIPSQAYMYNRAQAVNQSPMKEESTGKHFVNDVKAAVKGALVLLPILGIPWICGMWVYNSYELMMFFLIINSTQGLVIFIVYCLMNGEVRRAMQRHMQLAKIRSQNGRSRASSTSSLRSLNSKFTRSWRRKVSTESHPVHK